MLAIFKNGLVKPPQELNSPASESQAASLMLAKVPDETLKDFLASHSSNGFSLGFGDNALLAYAPPPERSINSAHQRMFTSVDDIYCIFLGSLTNLSNLNKQYGLSKNDNEAMFVIEAYRTLRDRGPYPAHQVLKDLEGSFGFVVFDNKARTVFVALGADEAIKLYWGIANGSVMISDNVNLVKSSCAKSFAPFPYGCMYHSERGLMSFEHPTNKMKAIPRVDSEGIMCGANFKADVLTKMHSMPRTNQSKVVVEKSEEITTAPVLCHCGKASKLRASWTDANPGRRFFCCERYGEESSGCGFFLWHDKPMCERSKRVIPGLRHNVKTLEDEIKRRRLREKLLWFALVGSWISVILFILSRKAGGGGEHQHINTEL